jgi:hypothetical protein
MNWVRPAIYVASGAVLSSLFLAIHYREETKGIADLYGNHASVLGLAVSVVGFALTV